MKKYTLCIIILYVFVLMGCENYLEKNPLDEISSNSFWRTKSDFDKALTANYGFMHGSTDFPNRTPPSGTWAYLLPNWDNITDNSYGQHNYGLTKSIVMGEITSTTEGYISGIYKYCYEAIARTNIFLKEIGQYNGSDFEQSDKNRYEAEIKFLRAFYYFQLYSFYGDVPLVLEPLNLENQIQPNAGSEQILDQVLNDLDFAIANLNDVSYYENNGHVSKSTAQALKARVLIYAAYGSDGTPNMELLKQVKDLCLEIMPMYSLSPKFEDLFQSTGQNGNTEIIFSVNYLAPDNVPINGPDLLFGVWISVSPLQSFVATFECTDGLPWGVSPLTNPDDPLENRDSRLNKTVFRGFVDWGGGNTQTPESAMPSGYGLKKFLEPGNTPYSRSTLSEQNAIVIRLAEVMLMYAEVTNEISGPDASVYKVIDDIRGRSGMPPLATGLSKDEMREKIRHERRIELAFEGTRYFDIKRWHIADEVYNNVKDGFLEYNWEDKFYQWPLPQEEIDKSQGVLTQNPDY